MTWNDGAMPRYCRCETCNEPDTEEDVMSEDMLVERLKRHRADLSEYAYVNQYAENRERAQERAASYAALLLDMDAAAARLTAQAEEIGRLKKERALLVARVEAVTISWRKQAIAAANYGIPQAIGGSPREYYGGVNIALSLTECADNIQAVLGTAALKGQQP